MSTPSLAEVIRAAIEARLSTVNVGMPAKVVKVDVAKAKCDVQPVLQSIDASGAPVTLPVITNVPIAVYRAGTAFLSLPVKVGNFVELRFSQRSLDTWLTKGGTVDPNDRRKFHLSDAIAYPGVYPFSDPPTGAHADKVVLKNNTGVIEISPDGKFRVTNGTDEVLDLLVQTLTKLSSGLDELTKVQTPTMMGPQTFLPPHIQVFTQLKGDVDGIKIKLEGLKGV